MLQHHSFVPVLVPVFFLFEEAVFFKTFEPVLSECELVEGNNRRHTHLVVLLIIAAARKYLVDVFGSGVAPLRSQVRG